jgi:hypothetical protein
VWSVPHSTLLFQPSRLVTNFCSLFALSWLAFILSASCTPNISHQQIWWSARWC